MHHRIILIRKEGARMEQSVPSKKSAMIIYILYLAGIVFPLTSIIGVIMAYIYISDEQSWLKSHYHFQIRTFWISVMLMVAGVLTSSIFIGFVILLFWLIWMIVRCVKGLRALQRGAEHPNPTGWLFD